MQRDGGKSWVLDKEALKRFSTNAVLPDATLGECLQLVANASGCSIIFDPDGRLHLAPVTAPAQTHAITPHNSYTKAEITLTKPVGQVDVSVYTYKEGEERPEETILTVNNPSGETVPGLQRRGDVVPLKNPLITKEEHARAIGGWLYEHLTNRRRASLDWRADPSFEVGDMANVTGTDGTSMKLWAVSFTLEFGGAFKGKLEGTVET
jgi:hypothetical protein